MSAPAIRLYEAVDALDAVEQQLEANGGELTPELEQLLDAAYATFEAKVEATAARVRELTLHAGAVKEEADRLAARQKTAEHAADRLKRYLEGQLERARRDRVKGTRFTVSLQRNAASLIGDLAPELLPVLAQERPELVKVTYELRRTATRDAIAGGFFSHDGLAVAALRSLRIR